jgi:hypothetical protein
MRTLMMRARVPDAALLVCALAACGPADDGIVLVADEHAGNPTVAADTANAYVAWIATVDSVSDVYFARIDGSGAGAPVRVNDVPGDAAPHEQAPPQVALAPDGTIHVVWQNNIHVPGRRFPASNLRSARSVDGGRTFEPAVFVNDDAAAAPASHTFQDIEVAEDGTVFVSWIDGRTRAHAEAHGGGDGALPGSEVRIARSTDGGRTFDAGTVVYHDVCQCCRTSLAVSGGRVAIAFRAAQDNIRDIVVVESRDGGVSFGAPVAVHRDGWQVESCPHAGASVDYDADGVLHVAWYTGADARQGLWYARAAEGAGFETPVAVQVGGWVPVSQVKLAADEDGAVWLAWDDRREEQPVVKLAQMRGGRMERVRFTANGRSPAVSAGSGVSLAWQDGAAVRVRQVRR